MTQRNLALPALLALAIAACQQSVDETDIAIDNGVNAAEAAAADVETLPPNDSSAAAQGTPAATTANEATPAAPPTAIPAQYRGRWGLVPADCTSTRGDAKGLIVVTDRTIRFYESTATLQEQRPAIATSFSGLYGFTGEGQSWERVETLTRTGNRLERRSTTPRGERGNALTYTRCA